MRAPLRARDPFSWTLWGLVILACWWWWSARDDDDDPDDGDDDPDWTLWETMPLAPEPEVPVLTR